MPLVTPSPHLSGVTTSIQMNLGPHTLLRQLMSNASAHLPTTPTPPTDVNTVTTQFKGGKFQICQMHCTHRFTQHEAHSEYNGALMDIMEH